MDDGVKQVDDDQDHQYCQHMLGHGQFLRLLLPALLVERSDEGVNKADEPGAHPKKSDQQNQHRQAQQHRPSLFVTPTHSTRSTPPVP